MTKEPNRTVEACSKKLEEGQDGRIDDQNASDKTLPQLLAKLEVEMIPEYLRGGHCQHTTTGVFSPPKRMSWIASDILSPCQGVYLDIKPTDETITTCNAITIFKVPLALALGPV